MPYLQRFKHDLKAGWAALRYGTVQAANRALEETELLRLRLEIRKLDARMQELYRDIGERVMDLHEQGEPAERILLDSEVGRTAAQVAVLKTERGKLMQEINAGRGE
jgi:hypothetical protein